MVGTLENKPLYVVDVGVGNNVQNIPNYNRMLERYFNNFQIFFNMVLIIQIH